MSCYSVLFLECRQLVSFYFWLGNFLLTEGHHRLFIGILAFKCLLDFMRSPIVDFKNVKSSFSNKYAIVVGISLQFIVLPFLGFCAVKLFSNEFKSTAISITLLVVTSR